MSKLERSYKWTPHILESDQKVNMISMGKKGQIALLCLSSWCLVIVVWLIRTMPRVCLQFVIVIFPDQTHLLILKKISLVNGLINL